MTRERERYESLLRAMARLSGLFSVNSAPYIDSRFVEKLYIETTGAKDLGRKDKSFDALHSDGSGVGVKTFLGQAGSAKVEKIAEFAALANAGTFIGLNSEELAHSVALARNTRVSSDVAEYGVVLDTSIYHCLIRISGGAVVHEEPYRLIEIGNLAPTNSNGTRKKGWGKLEKGVYFTDGLSDYTYSVSKNVLMKRFRFDRDTEFIPLEIEVNPFILLDQLVGRAPMGDTTRKDTTGAKMKTKRILGEEVRGRDYVVLPLLPSRSRSSVAVRHQSMECWGA